MKRSSFLSALIVLGISAHAAAQDDVTVILGNLDSTGEALVTGLQDTASTLAETQSAVAVSAALGDTVTNAGIALVDGTEQFAHVGPDLVRLNGDIQRNVNPFAALIDEPSQKNLDAAFKREDLTQIGENLSFVDDALLGPDPNLPSMGVKPGVRELLQGNLVAYGIRSNRYEGSAVGGSLLGVGSATYYLFYQTNYDWYAGGFARTVFTAAYMANDIATGFVEPLEPSLAPVFEDTAPVTVPAYDAVMDFDTGDVTDPIFWAPFEALSPVFYLAYDLLAILLLDAPSQP